MAKTGVRTGQCSCGVVRYELDGELGALVNCHCQYCRRAHGAAFATVSMVRSADLRFSSGAGSVRAYQTAEGCRYFCERCGTRLFNRARSSPQLTFLVIASLDEEPAEGPVMHINLESKAPWYEILDDLPQHEALPAVAKRALRD
jgi:hypothetical protein